jgi:uncharacterized protein
LADPGIWICGNLSYQISNAHPILAKLKDLRKPCESLFFYKAHRLCSGMGKQADNAEDMLQVFLSYDMISDMSDTTELNQSQATTLCKACGLCCTGHLFIWVKLRPRELDSAEALGMTVLRTDPTQRGFNQPCPLWLGQCTIYDSPHYPRACLAYKCKLLKELFTESRSLPEALTVVEQAKRLFGEMEALLPKSSNVNFRERLVTQIEHPQESAWGANEYATFKQKAQALLLFYDRVFGVNNLLEKS